MRSTKDALLERGFADIGLELLCAGLGLEDKLSLLHSGIAFERTLAARLLLKNKDEKAIQPLIEALRKEKKLYPKMEICKTLVSFGAPAVKPLIDELGKIGKNQHITVPQEKFKKKSYPLPRDIVSRTLGYMGTPALPDLLNSLEKLNKEQLNAAIDSIGYICFYNHCHDVFDRLKACFLLHKENELIRWKVIRAMSAFPESKTFLSEQILHEYNTGIKLEIERSLSLIG